MKLSVRVRNSFHSTESEVKVPADSKILGPRTVKKLRAKLCASDCRCFGSHTQYFGRAFSGREIRLFPTELPDGGIQLMDYSE